MEATSGARDFGDLTEISPFCPQQKNQSDCGIFVLEYLERLLLAADAPLPTIADLSQGPAGIREKFRNWFTHKDVAGKRETIRRLICGTA